MYRLATVPDAMLHIRSGITSASWEIPVCSLQGSPRVGPVDVPVPARRGQPPRLAVRVPDRCRGEPADDPLPALVVAVEQFRRPGLAGLDDLSCLLVPGLLGVAERALPEPDVADGNVQIPGLPHE